MQQKISEGVPVVDRQASVEDLIERYKQTEKPVDKETARKLRHEFVRAIRDDPELLKQLKFSSFLAKVIEPGDLAVIEWGSPDDMVLFGESLYLSRVDDEQIAHQLNQHASFLLHCALNQYEKEGKMEKVFRHLRIAPSYLLRQDEELKRLLNRAKAYEIRRVRRSRRYLYGYLVVQAVLILFIFPYLFINAENGKLQKQVEQLADVELGDEGYQLITYQEGMYWAVITAGSIGYGDITPTTTTGRLIAGVLGIMGVITVGILAGLVLDWISPRLIL